MENRCNKLKNEIADIIGIKTSNTTGNIAYKILETTQEEGYTRQLIEYDSCGDKVSAFLLLPEILENNPAILIHHQHNREHHLGKSEVCGEKGFLFNNAYIYASKKERETMNKKPHYKQSGTIFVMIGMIFLINAVEMILDTGWLFYLVVAVAVIAIIYAIVSSVSYKEWLMFSNGSQIINNTAHFFGLKQIGLYNEHIPNDYIVIGELIGDGELLCFSKNTGKIIRYTHGRTVEYQSFKEILNFILNVV